MILVSTAGYFAIKNLGRAGPGTTAQEPGTTSEEPNPAVTERLAQMVSAMHVADGAVVSSAENDGEAMPELTSMELHDEDCLVLEGKTKFLAGNVWNYYTISPPGPGNYNRVVVAGLARLDPETVAPTLSAIETAKRDCT